MISTLFARFRAGPLPWVADQLQLLTPEVRDVLPVSLLTHEAGCASMLSRYLQIHAGDTNQIEQRRARISMWSQWYFANLLPAWVIVSLSHNWQLPIRPDRLFISLQQQGLPGQLYFQGEAQAFTPDTNLPLARFTSLIEQHLRPVCQALAALSDMKPGIYWGNAAVRLHWGIEQAALLNADTTDGLALINARTLSDGGKNPLFQPLRAEHPDNPDSPLFRRQCCLRYRLADHAMCSSCPLLLVEKRRRRDS